MRPAVTLESDRCLTDDEVAALVEGRLATDERARVERHLDTCSECRLWVAAAVKASAGSSTTLPPQQTSDWSKTAAPADPGQPITRGAAVGPYVILERLGSGGMGVVYAAYDPRSDRRVALKLVRSQGKKLEKWAALREQLRHEAQAMTQFSHPNIVTIHGTGEHGDQLYLAMDLVEGTTARGWLRAAPRRWEQVLDVYAQAGRGLAAAHAAGWVHRDFKPDNVLVGDDGRVCVSDFGLAKLTDIPLSVRMGLGCPEKMRCETPTGAKPGVAVPGTLSYMAPEQLSGQKVGERTDLFSFCVALYEALYGVLPFPPLVGGFPAGGELVINPAPIGSEVPVRLRNALLKGLKLSPADRYKTMQPLLQELDAIRALRSA